MDENSDLLDFAHTLADTARGITLSYFRQPISVNDKKDGSPVTIADQRTEQILREQIESRFPDHGVTGEEKNAKISPSAYEWVLDPIDGTRSFISGYPLYGTLICLLKDGKPALSIIDMPAMNERFFATTEQSTRYRKGDEEHEITTSHCVKLDGAMLFSTDYSMFSYVENKQAKRLRDAVNMVRYNGDCYLYAMLSLGLIDIVLEADLKVYDFIPLKLIIEQAGGIISDWEGRPLSKNSSGQVLASSNPTLHQLALEKLHNND